MKIQTKTTILFTILTATIFLILNITVYYVIDSFAHRDFNKRVELRARISAKFRFEQNSLSTQAFSQIQRQYLEKLPEEQAFIVRLKPGTNQPEEKPDPSLDPSFLKDVVNADGETVFYQNRFRHFAGLLYKDPSGNYLVRKSATNRYGEEMMKHLEVIKLVQFICAVLLVYSVGLYFSRKAFKPIRDIVSRLRRDQPGKPPPAAKKSGRGAMKSRSLPLPSTRC
jgi:hypothetical protein